MAIYRPASRRPLVIVGAVALVVGLALGFVAGQATAPGLPAQLNALGERVGAVSSALEVVRVHYPEVLAGTAGAASAQQGMDRAEQSFAAVEADLALIDPEAADDAYRALQDLRALVDARAPVESVDAAIDAALERLNVVTPGTTR